MIEIKKPRIECIETPTDSSYGKYIIEPLERGYGTTLGNSLRRVLLSSLPGIACTSIKIAGVQHEFSTIPGVKEDVTEIVLNVKSIIARHQARRRGGDPQPRAAHRDPRSRRCAEHGAGSGSRQGLCLRRQEQEPPDAHRHHPGRLHLYPGPQGQLYGGEHPCRQPDRL